MTPLGLMAGGVLGLQLVWGAFMAGLRAGHVTDEWPLMNGAIWPGPTQMGQSYSDRHRRSAIVHFIHRWWAWVVVGVLIVLARALKQRGLREPSIAIHSAFGTQSAGHRHGDERGVDPAGRGASIGVCAAAGHGLGHACFGSERWS
jgi:cytochrome c oxidase assembly protein subunit 15